MNTPLFLRILLALHLTGLVIMAGTTVVDYFTFKTFCRLADGGDHRSVGLLPIMARYGELVRTGAVIIILTGIGMLVLARGIWWEQPWFRIKLALVVLLIGNGMFVGNKQGLKFRKLFTDSGPDLIQQTADIGATLNRFYLMQLTLFFVIILLSVIKLDRGPIK
jgi:hypothetical protein